jgi:hypothetical protein
MNDANELLGLPPEQVAKYAHEKSDDINTESQFNWHLVAEISASNAIRLATKDRVAALSWAVASVIIYDRLDATAGPQELQFFGLSAAEVRSNTILSLGPEPGHLVLDPKNVEDWFFRQASMTLDQAKELARQWVDLSPDDAFRLLHLRNCFGAVKPLQAEGLFNRDKDLSDWEAY